MAHFIVSPVEATPADMAWIENLRRIHDPHHGLVVPHATLVFGFERPPLDAVIDYVGDVSRLFAPISCRFDSVLAVRDLTGVGSHLFLIPKEGAAEIVALHDTLYGGPLRGELRADIPFVPHVTIGRVGEHAVAQALAERLSDEADIAARLTRLDLVAFAGVAVAPIVSWPIGDGRPPG